MRLSRIKSELDVVLCGSKETMPPVVVYSRTAEVSSSAASEPLLPGASEPDWQADKPRTVAAATPAHLMVERFTGTTLRQQGTRRSTTATASGMETTCATGGGLTTVRQARASSPARRGRSAR